MNLAKSMDFFDPSSVNGRIHIIGCGSVGSTLAENLVRCGVTKLTLWDFDVVESHNLVNQMFRLDQIGKSKVEALADLLLEINPECELKIQPNGWNGENLSGYIFLAVDNIELRKQIVEKNMMNMSIKAVFDIRTMLTGAQHFAANWNEKKHRDDLLSTMQFSHEEAKDETPTSACGFTLGVAPTVRVIAGIAVMNFIGFVNGGSIRKFVQFDLGEQMFMDAV